MPSQGVSAQADTTTTPEFSRRARRAVMIQAYNELMPRDLSIAI